MTNENTSSSSSTVHTTMTTGQSQQQINKIMESITRISLAGLGGALAGLSIAKTRSIRHIPSMTTLAHTSSSLSVSIPLVWAFGCSTFTTIIEISNLISPTGFMRQVIFGDEFSSSSSSSSSSESMNNQIDRFAGKDNIDLMKDFLYLDYESIQTIGDYTIGGAMAGAIIKGYPASNVSHHYQDGYSNNNTTQNPNGYHNGNTIANNNSPEAMKQRQMIGKGKVITLESKHGNNASNRNSSLSTTKPKIQNNSTSMFLNNSDPKRTATTTKFTSTSNNTIRTPLFKSSISGLIPGIALGFLAGSMQFLLQRLQNYFRVLQLQQEQEQNNNNTVDEQQQ